MSALYHGLPARQMEEKEPVEPSLTQFFGTDIPSSQYRYSCLLWLTEKGYAIFTQVIYSYPSLYQSSTKNQLLSSYIEPVELSVSGHLLH